MSLLAVPLNAEVLKALDDGPRALVDLRRRTGSPPQTTMRAHLRSLTEQGILAKRRLDGFPGTVEYALTPAGGRLVGVAAVLEAWLRAGPQRAALASAASKSVVKALTEAWNLSIVRALAARPLSLTDLNKLISSLNYPSLERRFSALKLAGLIEPAPHPGRGTPYQPSEWLRRAIGPLTAAAAWEREHQRESTAPLGRLDAEAAFLLALPLLRLPAGVEGTCRLAVEMPGENGRRLVGVMAAVAEGRVRSCAARLEGAAAGWAAGSMRAWFAAAIEGDAGALEIGGDGELAIAIVDGLHRELFAEGARTLTQPQKFPSF